MTHKFKQEHEGVLKVLKESEKNKILNQLNEQFGIKELKGIITKKGKERLFLFQGDLNEKEIEKFENLIPTERIGVYFAKFADINNQEELRLSIEGVHLLQEQITKNLFHLENEKQVEEWMSGADLQMPFPIQEEQRGFKIIKYKDDFLGCGKASENKIGNFIPKTRRLKLKS